MKTRPKINAASGQLRWVILLLAVAVILPTVCLLWFMSQAVKNVQLVARQELTDLYRKELQSLAESTDKRWLNYINLISDISHSNKKSPVKAFSEIITDKAESAGKLVTPFAGAAIYGSDGKVVYPIVASNTGTVFDLPNKFQKAWKLEFEQKRLSDAISIYQEIAASTNNDYIYRYALMGETRCLRKSRKIRQAFEVCNKIGILNIYPGTANSELFENVERTKEASIPLIVQARLLRTILIKESLALAGENVEDIGINYEEEVCRLLILGTMEDSAITRAMSAGTRMYLIHKGIELAQEEVVIGKINERKDKAYYSERLNRLLLQAKTRLAAEELSLSVAQRYPTTASFAGWSENTLHRLDLPGDFYGIYCKSNGKRYLVVPGPDTIRIDLDQYKNACDNSLFGYQVINSDNDYVAGAQKIRESVFLQTPFGKYFSGWRVRLYCKDATVFEEAASKQTALYTWTGLLVIVLILSTGGFAGQAVGRQIKLNRLKNDFIATVSHELKTPLASMRVLVDTLLEGNYKDQKQATEYLQLTAKENERLSRLIDNFLTFSRMERNKQAFKMTKTSPAAIARAAAEVVKTKFSEGRCEFEVKISEDLPDVLTDRDAIVTVLVNLLDNAYKYSYDDKHIELRVFTEDGLVCFSVADDGVGMSRRTTTKIFKRFYQVDRSLSRRAQGCGLGLSIAKFIVDAHKGSITVDSKPGKGSTFAVKLPAAN